MHEGEIKTDADQVRRLIAAQFPRWADRPVVAVPQSGTDHLLYRIGDDMVARMPRIDWALDQVDSDAHWLPILAPHLPVPIPRTLAIGVPGEGYPWPWSIVAWLVGANPTADNADLDAVAVQLAAFIAALARIDTTGGPTKTGTMRGVPLADRDELTRTAIAELGDRIDTRAVTAAWDEALSAEPWDGPPVWIHGDLQIGNLLVHEGKLSAVIDFGGLGLGDPAVDLMPAWNLFDARSRRTFRTALGCDDDAWQRGRGWALSTAVVGMPYYWDTAPEFVADGQNRLAQILM